MANSKTTSPTLHLVITDENFQRAREADSGGCLIADAIKSQYPQYTNAMVDVATIRFSDKETGVRYTYLTPEDARTALLFFDQGWPSSIRKVTVKRAVQVAPLVQSPGRQTEEERTARLAELEAKLASGEPLTPREKQALTRLRKPRVERPARSRKATATSDGTVVGGYPLRTGKKNPNLLAGRHRVFGAKIAQPARVFTEAVEEAVEAAKQAWIAEQAQGDDTITNP